MIPILNLTRQYEALKEPIEAAMIGVARSGHYILGPNVSQFEEEMAHFLGAKHVIGCANGSDALSLALAALKVGPGDEVITTTFSYIATSEAIVRVGAKPVFADIYEDTLNLDISHVESLITPRTKAILPVHIFGQPAAMQPLLDVARKHNLRVIEDCAQSIGSQYRGRMTGTMGDIGCFSFFPSKNLGAFGDGGMLTTNDDHLAERLRMLRVHGSKKRYYHEEAGINSRLDELQAAILRVKLPHLKDWNTARFERAQRYNELLKPLAEFVETPTLAEGVTHVFHQYTLKLKNATPEYRASVMKHMQEAGVQTMIYYPVPLHRQQTHANLNLNPADYPVCERVSDQVMSLPMFPELTDTEQQTVVNALTEALKKQPVRV